MNDCYLLMSHILTAFESAVSLIEKFAVECGTLWHWWPLHISRVSYGSWLHQEPTSHVWPTPCKCTWSCSYITPPLPRHTSVKYTPSGCVMAKHHQSPISNSRDNPSTLSDHIMKDPSLKPKPSLFIIGTSEGRAEKTWKILETLFLSFPT